MCPHFVISFGLATILSMTRSIMNFFCSNSSLPIFRVALSMSSSMSILSTIPLFFELLANCVDKAFICLFVSDIFKVNNSSSIRPLPYASTYRFCSFLSDLRASLCDCEFVFVFCIVRRSSHLSACVRIIFGSDSSLDISFHTSASVTWTFNPPTWHFVSIG